jgi:rhamnosyltransferase
MTQAPAFSIIIRTRNEERWITHCLRRIAAQTRCDYEIVLVDNASTDKTVERALALRPDIKLVTVETFRPGHAINEGVQVSSGRYIVCLSAHCLPAHDDWLERLVGNFGDLKLAGVYGRQIPMSFTSAQDKRDLLVTFGLDRRVQYRDPFFHNANSMVPRQVWERFPFAEDVTNIEDRVWAQQVLEAGYHIIYDPDASVYHHHGIHQNNDPERASSVVRVMEESGTAVGYADAIDPDQLDIVAILPALGSFCDIGTNGVLVLLEHAVRAVQSSAFVTRLLVSTTDEEVAAGAKALGCVVPHLRPKELARADVRVDRVLQYELEAMENAGDYPDLVMSLEVTHPFRPPGLFDDLVRSLLRTGVDTVIAGRPELRPCWNKDSTGFQRLDRYLQQRQDRDPLHIGLPGLGCVSLPHVIREGSRFGRQTGIVELHDPLATIEVRNKTTLERIGGLLRPNAAPATGETVKIVG